MALGVRLKKSHSESKPFGRRKSGKVESHGNDSYRGRGQREESKSLFTEKKFARTGRDSEGTTFGRKPFNERQREFRRDEYDGETNSRGARREMRGEDSEGMTFRRKPFNERRREFGRNEYDGETRSRGASQEMRGEDGEAMTFRRKPFNERRREFGRDEYDGETRSRGANREMRGDRAKRDSHRGERIPFRSQVSDQLRSRGRNADSSRREFGRGEYDGKTRSQGASREMRGDRLKRDNRRGERIPFRSPVIDQLRSRGRNADRRRKNVGGDDAEEMMGGRRKMVRELRGGRGRKGDDRREEMDGNGHSVEASSDNLRLKWKKMDKKRKDTSDEEKTGGHREEDDNLRDKGKRTCKVDDESEGEDNQVAEQIPVRRKTRVLDKFGKKIRVAQRRLDNGPAEEVTPVKKKRRRVIKIDPYDISNKRLDDSPPTIDHADKNEEKDSDKDSEISKNAQFRAIQPSPSILSFVEDNLVGRRRLSELKDAGYDIKLSAPLDNVPFSTSTDRERVEENLFRSKLEFFAAAKISSSFPPPVIPEIAFAGRSNVGKSSILNALTRQWGVVRTSDKPGLTQTINFFNLASKLSLVDLPGYGFAYAKEEVKEAWEELVKEYVSTRVGLQRVCLLIDTKWGMKPRDYELIDLMERSRTAYQIVLTKTDLVFPIDVARRAMQIQENLKKNNSIVNPVMMVSSKSGAGIRNLRSVLSKITRFVKP